MPDRIADAGMEQLLQGAMTAGQPIGNLNQVLPILDGIGAGAQQAQTLPPELLASLPPDLLAILGINPSQPVLTAANTGVPPAPATTAAQLIPAALSPQGGLA